MTYRKFVLFQLWCTDECDIFLIINTCSNTSRDGSMQTSVSWCFFSHIPNVHLNSSILKTKTNHSWFNVKKRQLLIILATVVGDQVPSLHFMSYNLDLKLMNCDALTGYFSSLRITAIASPRPKLTWHYFTVSLHVQLFIKLPDFIHATWPISGWTSLKISAKTFVSLKWLKETRKMNSVGPGCKMSTVFSPRLRTSKHSRFWSRDWHWAEVGLEVRNVLFAFTMKTWPSSEFWKGGGKKSVWSWAERQPENSGF